MSQFGKVNERMNVTDIVRSGYFVSACQCHRNDRRYNKPCTLPAPNIMRLSHYLRFMLPIAYLSKAADPFITDFVRSLSARLNGQAPISFSSGEPKELQPSNVRSGTKPASRSRQLVRSPHHGRQPLSLRKSDVFESLKDEAGGGFSSGESCLFV